MDQERAEQYRQAYLERNRKNGERQLSEEESMHRKELARLRQKRYREKKKAKKQAVAHVAAQKVEPTTEKRRTRLTQKEQESQRQKWRDLQRKCRAGWSAQKRRRHREKALEYYYGTKAKAHLSTPLKTPEKLPSEAVPNDPEVPAVTPGERKAVYRAKKAVMGFKSFTFSKLIRSIGKLVKKSPRKQKAMETIYGSPSAKAVKRRCLSALENLKTKRSKKALAARKLLMDTLSGNEAPMPGSYSRKKTEKAADVERFLEEVAVDMPGKQTVRNGVQKKLLPKRVKHLHRDYVRERGKISLATFYRHMPKNVMKCSKQKFRQGLCETCAGIDLKLDIFNRFLSKPIDGRDCLSEASLCPTPTLACLQRECDCCGVHVVKEHIMSNLTEQTSIGVVWYQWGMVASEGGKGKKAEDGGCGDDEDDEGKKKGKKRKDVVVMRGSLAQLISELLKDLERFSYHVFIARWQRMQLHTAMNAITDRPKLAVAICDFSENYQLKHQDEVQSAHWGYVQITIHPTVLYYKCPQCPNLVTDYLVFATDDLNKDAALAKLVMDQAIDYLRKMSNVEEIIIFSDGCAAQFKSRLPLFLLANNDSPVDITRAFFGASHGKSPSDACGGVVKNLLDDDVRMMGLKLRDAKSLVDHCSAHYCLPEFQKEGCCHTRRSFVLVDKADVDRSFPSKFLQPIPGTRSFHCVRGSRVDDPLFIQSRKLACFCTACLDRDGGECKNKAFVQSWDSVKLKFTKCAPTPETRKEPETRKAPETPFERPLSQHQFFAGLYQRMIKCQSFQELKNLVADTSLEKFPMPPAQNRTIVEIKGAVDGVAMLLRPSTVPPDLFPVVTVGDGNCLSRALSTTVYGKEGNHLEMRCRIVLELVSNFQTYVRGEGMGGARVVQHLVVLSDVNTGLTPDQVCEDNIRQTLEEEVMGVRRKGTFMGLWQLAAAASVLGRPIQSVYPEKGWAVYQEMNNRTLVPRTSSGAPACFVMWTSARTDMDDNHWTANHFTPLMPISGRQNDTVTLVNVGNFAVYNTFTLPDVALSDCFWATWDGHDVVCRVDNIYDDATLFLNFMVEEKNGLYTWPALPDTSVESVSVLKSRLCLDLDVSVSNNRKQYYKVVQ